MKMHNLILLILIAFLFYSCKNDVKKGSTIITENIDKIDYFGENETQKSNEENKETFEKFFERFCKDKQFQLSRIQFPVGQLFYRIDEPCDPNSKYYDEYLGECINAVELTSDNWTFLEKCFFKVGRHYENDRIEGWFEDRSVDTKTFIVGVPDSEALCIVDFGISAGKWYLTRFYDAAIR